MSLEVKADRELIRRSSQSVRHLLITVEAPLATPREGRMPVNVSFVIDRSGSMADGKIEQACSAVVHAIGRLESEDRFSVVDYDHKIAVTVEPTLATAAAKRAARSAVEALRIGGRTNLAGGWLKGCGLIAEALHDESVARCLLLTDGHANEGIRSRDELAEHAGALRQRGVVTSTFGIGEDFDEHLLGAMAQRGGGNFHYLSSAEVIPRAFDQELGETLEIVARDAKLLIEAPEIEIRSLNEFPTRVYGARKEIDLGALVSGQVLQAVIELRFPVGTTGTTREIAVSVVDRDESLACPPVVVQFTHARGTDVDAQSRNRGVDREVAALHAAGTRRIALALNRDGEFAQAGAVLARCIQRIAAYAGDDPELARIRTELERVQQELSRPVDSGYSKSMYSSSYNQVMSRSSTSSSKRRARNARLAIMSTIATQRPAMDVALGALSALARLGVHTKLEQLDTGLLGLATPLTHEMELQLAVHARAFAPAAGLHLVFTAHAFEDQWFSHQHAGRGVTVVSTAAAERARDVSLAAFVAYEVLLHALSLASPYYDMPTLLHEEERGCLFDLCREHARLPFKLDAMGLCGSCRTQLDHWHIDVGVVDLLAGAVAGLQRQASVSLT